MCLPVTPYKVEREWKAFGLSCAVVVNRPNQNRCGYVRVPPGHPAHGRDYYDVNVEVHGGLTFAQIEPCSEHEDGQGYWLGFDCAHSGDASYDPSVKPKDLSPSDRRVWYLGRSLWQGHFWTQPEVEAECERLAQQLAEMS